MQAKRLVAQKASVAEISRGKFVKKGGFESSYVITVMGRKLSRVRVLGLVVDKYTKEGNTYASLTLDDGTDTVRCKVFINISIFDGITKGDLVDVFGKVKEYNNEIYVMPEIVRKVDPNYETLRLLELEQVLSEQKIRIEKIKQLPTRDINELKILLKGQIGDEEIEAIVESGCLEEKKEETKQSPKDIVLRIIAQSAGIDYLSIIEKSGLDENTVDQIIQELLENKTCSEPSPGVIKIL